MTKEEQDQLGPFEPITEQEAREGMEEMVSYIMDIDDKEITESYADTFMYIAKCYAQGCKDNLLI